MTRRMYYWVGAMGVLAATACQPPAPAMLSDADMAAIRAVSDSFVAYFKAGDYEKLAGLYTEDGTIMPPNEPAVQGRVNIQAFMGNFPKAEDMRFTNFMIDGRGDLAYVTANYWMKLTGMPADSGKFVEVRQKDPDGVWRLKYDIFNSNVPLPPPPPAPTRRR